MKKDIEKLATEKLEQAAKTGIDMVNDGVQSVVSGVLIKVGIFVLVVIALITTSCVGGSVAIDLLTGK